MENDKKTQYAMGIEYSTEELQEAENYTFFNVSHQVKIAVAIKQE